METTRALTKTGGITETGLKWIALVTMVMDHIHYFFGHDRKKHAGCSRNAVKGFGSGDDRSCAP